MPGSPSLKELAIAEHDDISVQTKKVSIYGWTGFAKVKLKTNSNGELVLSGSGATTPTIYNIALTSANTEYSQNLPANTKKFRIYAVDSTKRYPHSDALKVCFIENQSNTTFIPIPASGFYQEEDINLTGKTIFFQSPTGSGNVIIVAWS